MSGIMSHVVRRGLVAAGTPTLTADDDILGSVNWLALAYVAIFWVGFMSIQYTYGEVIATLAMVEAPETETNIAIKVIGEKDEKEMEEIETVTKLPPITSQFFRSVGVLHARAGSLAPYRGLSLYLVYNIMTALVSGLFLQLGLGSFLTTVITLVLFSRWGMTWTHIVISMPRAEWWCLRVPPIGTWKKIAPATALYAIASYLATAYPAVYFRACGLDRVALDASYWRNQDLHSRQIIVVQLLACVLIGLTLSVLLVLPTSVMLTRIQASMLPEEVEPIFHMDRTFGGRVVSEADGGSGQLGIREAWQSFDWAARIRLLKLYGKLGAIQLAIVSCFIGFGMTVL